MIEEKSPCLPRESWPVGAIKPSVIDVSRETQRDTTVGLLYYAASHERGP